MIEFELGVEALGATRIGYSPLGELASSVRAWRDRDATSLLGPLLGDVDRRVSAADLDLLRLLVPRDGLVPDLHYPVRHVGRDLRPVEPAEDALRRSWAAPEPASCAS